MRCVSTSTSIAQKNEIINWMKIKAASPYLEQKSIRHDSNVAYCGRVSVGWRHVSTLLWYPIAQLLGNWNEFRLSYCDSPVLLPKTITKIRNLIWSQQVMSVWLRPAGTWLICIPSIFTSIHLPLIYVPFGLMRACDLAESKTTFVYCLYIDGSTDVRHHKWQITHTHAHRHKLATLICRAFPLSVWHLWRVNAQYLFCFFVSFHSHFGFHKQFSLTSALSEYERQTQCMFSTFLDSFGFSLSSE